jgi:chemotaxis signal transduction protein
MSHDSKAGAADLRPATRALQLMFAGTQCVGLFADEIAGIADWRPPTPLPGAPAGVLGVVCIRGRMLTVLAAGVLLGEASVNSKIVALRGAEQIALAVQHVGDVINFVPSSLPVSSEKGSLVLGVLTDGGRSISVVDHTQLFATAMRGRERRRRHF